MKTRDSEYTPGKTCDEVADDWVADIKRNAKSTDPEEAITCEWGYGASTMTAIQVTLAGGGPAADITFLFAEGEEDDDPREAYFTYYESGAWTRYISEYDATEIWNAMRRTRDDLVLEEEE